MSDYSNLASYAVSLVINLTVVGAFFAVGVGLSFRLVQQLSPRVRYIIVVIAFIAAAALPIRSTLRVSQEPTAAFQIATAIEREQHTSTATPILNQGSQNYIKRFDETGISNDNSRSKNESQTTILNQSVLLLNAFVRTWAESWPGVGFIALWVFVAALLVGREVLGYIHLVRARQDWRLADAKTIDYLVWPAAYTLFISECEGPCTVGLVRPAVVLPSDLLDNISLDAARLIARHELAHARWRDPLINALLRITRALLWPSLPLWYLGRVARTEREAASDFSAVGGCLSEEMESTVIDYASLLVLVAGRPCKKLRHWKYELAATEAGNQLDLEGRVVRLLNISSRPTRARVLLAAFALIATVWGAGSLPVTAKPIVVAPNSSISGASAVGESKEASADSDTAAVPSADRSIFLAAHKENLRSSYNEQLIERHTERETASRASELPSDNAQEPSQIGTGPSLALQTSPANQNEISHDFMDEMAALGYTNLSSDQLAAMKAYGVSRAYITEMAASGYNKLPADALINFRWLGLTSAYIKDMSKLGYSNLSANTMIDFRLYGITASYIKEMAALGFANLPAKTLVAFRRLGISEAYIKELKAQGHEHLTADQIINMHTQNVAVSESGKRSNGQND